MSVLVLGLATSLLVPVNDQNVSRLLQPGTEDWLVMYTHSQRPDLLPLQSEFITPASDPKTQKLNYVIIDCAVNNTVCEAHNITEVPEFRYIKNGQLLDYEWEWTSSGFYLLGHKLTNPPSYNLQRRQVFDNFKSRYDFSFISWYFPLVPDMEHIAKGEMLGNIAKDYWHRPFYFAQAAETSLRESEGIGFSDLPLVKQYGNDEVFSFTLTQFNETSLRAFIEDHKWGLMTPLNHSLWKVVHKDCEIRQKVLVLVFHSGSNYTHYSDYVNNLRLLHWDMRRYRDYRFQFASVDVEKYPDLALKYQVATFPYILAIDWSQNRSNITPLTFDPTSKIDTLKGLWRLWAGEAPSKPTISYTDLRLPESVKQRYPSWKHWAVVAVILSVWWGVKTVAGTLGSK